MASDRSPLSKRLKSLAHRAGISADDDPAVEREPAVAVPPAPAAPPQPVAADDDEQPTGDVPVVEPPTDEQQALTDEQPTTTLDPLGHGEAPSLTPPVVPARPVDQPADDESDDEPFSPRSTIWPQTKPTPRFEPAATDTPTFPEPSPEPAATDELGPTPATTGAAGIPAPAEPAATALTATELPSDVSSHDAATEQAAVDPDATGRLRVLGKLRRKREPDATVTAVATDAPAEAPAPAPAPAIPPAPQPPSEPHVPIEPPAKPTFTERAALRRRAKSLRARRDSGLLELGAIVLDQRRFGDPTGGALVRRRTDELADLDSELAAIEQVLDDDGPAETVAQLGVVRCLSCTALVGPRDRFCVQCGSPRPEDASATATTQ